MEHHTHHPHTHRPRSRHILHHHTSWSLKMVAAVGMFLVFSSAFAYFVLTSAPTLRNPPQDYFEHAIIIGGTKLKVDIADTVAKRALGLSGKTSLPAYHGMLFVFDTSDIYHFWMKDMNFPIDIIWISSDKKVVDITHHATPESYHTDPPLLFSPRVPAKYVVEVPADFTDEYNIFVGDAVQL